MTTTFGWNIGINAVSWADNFLDAASKYIPSANATAVTGIIARGAATVGGVYSSFKRSSHIYQQAEQENPNRSTIRKWASHPIKRYAFVAPAIALSAYLGVKSSQAGQEYLSQADSPNFEGTLDVIGQVLGQYETAHQICWAISMLPTLSDCYEVTKHSAKTLWSLTQRANTTISEKIGEAIIPLANLAFEFSYLKGNISNFSTKSIIENSRKSSQKLEKAVKLLKGQEEERKQKFYDLIAKLLNKTEAQTSRIEFPEHRGL